MHEQPNSEALFLKHLPWIDKVAAMACSKHGMWGAETEDFAGWVKMKLVENDYSALRKFRGDADFKTFLTTVVVRLFHDYMRERRGRWRPSTAAVRLGSPAKELEALVYRDGYRLEQAGLKLRTAGHTTLSDTELARLLAQIPLREPLRPVEVLSEPALHEAEGPSRADERVAAAEAEARRGEVMKALHRALERLEPEERMIVRMYFADGYTLADVARALGLDPKPLYRRVKRLRTRLRDYLEEGGVRGLDVHRLLQEHGGP